MGSIFSGRAKPAELRRRLVGWHWIWVWLPAAVACGVIAAESTATFSAQHTSSWLRPIFERFLGSIDEDTWQLAHHIFRKSGHFLGYGLVGLAFLRAWLFTFGRREGLGTGAWRLQSCAAAVGCTALVASVDEWHQTFLPSRTGAFSDVVLDTCGALGMCGVVWVVFRWWRSADVS